MKAELGYARHRLMASASEGEARRDNSCASVVPAFRGNTVYTGSGRYRSTTRIPSRSSHRSRGLYLNAASWTAREVFGTSINQTTPSGLMKFEVLIVLDPATKSLSN
jgi:hypothetical protein